MTSAERIAAAIARQPARAVACPTCGSPVGSPCKRPSGYTIPGGGVHAERRDLAQQRAAGGAS